MSRIRVRTQGMTNLSGGGGGGGGNNAPTNITLSNSSINDNAVDGDVVGTITVTDADDTTLNSLTVSNNKFKVANISGLTAQLQRSATSTLTAGVDETLTLTAQDAHGNNYTSGTKTITVNDHTAETLLETLTVRNYSGASRSDPYVFFRRSFEEGDVPSGSFVEVRYSGTAISLQQADGRTYNDDGSLRHATFSCKPTPGSVSDNGTFTLTLYKKSGSFSNSSSISRSTLTGQDYRVEVTYGSTTYYCLLNNLDAAGTYREIRVGNTIRGWKHWGVLRNGTGGGATDEGQLQAIFYSYVLSDGRIVVFAEVINGRVATSASKSVTACNLKNGSTTLVSMGSFTFYGMTSVLIAGTDALPYWSSSATDMWVDVDAQYMFDKKLLPKIYSSSTQRSAIGSGSAVDHVANFDLTGGGYIDQGGGSAWIGVITQYSALALLSNNKTRIRNDRVYAFGQATAHNRWIVNATTGFPPVLTNTDYTSSGLSAAQTSITTYDGSITNDGEPSWSAHDFSHQPTYGYLQYIATGWEWHLDHHLICVVGTGMSAPSGTPSYERNPIINGTQQYGVFPLFGQGRHAAWGTRSCDNLSYVRPDDWPAAAYADEISDNGHTYWEKWNTAPFKPSTLDALGITEMGEGAAGDGLYAEIWHHDYYAIAYAMALYRGQITASHKSITHHIIKFVIGRAVDACPYWGIGCSTVAQRVATPPGGTLVGTDPYPQTWADVYVGQDSNSGVNIKLISDAGGVSGSCPASGLGAATEAYGAGHTYPAVAHAMANVCAAAGITGASSIVSYLDTHEAGLGIAEADWNGNPQWRLGGYGARA